MKRLKQIRKLIAKRYSAVSDLRDQIRLDIEELQELDERLEFSCEMLEQAADKLSEIV